MGDTLCEIARAAGHLVSGPATIAGRSWRPQDGEPPGRPRMAVMRAGREDAGPAAVAFP